MRKTTFLLLLCAATVSATVKAEDIKVEKFRYAGPFAVRQPLMVDSVRPDNSKFEESELLATDVNLKLVDKSTVFTDSILPQADGSNPSLSLLQFGFNNTSYTKVKINVSKLKSFKLFVDGKPSEAGSEIAMIPQGHCVTIKYMSKPGERDTAVVSICETRETGTLSLVSDYSKPWKIYNTEVGTQALITTGLRPSADGLYYIQTDFKRTPDNRTTWTYTVKDVKTNTVRLTSYTPVAWTRDGHTLRKFVGSGDSRRLVLVDVQTLAETVLWDNVPSDDITLLPNMKQGIVSKTVKGEEPNGDMRIYYHPEDRIPGWRSRTNLSLYDFETGITQPLTVGFRSTWLCDVSLDSRKMLFATKTECLEKMRPTTETALCIMDLQTLEVDTIVPGDGFFDSASFSPDGTKVLVKASAEFANRIGCTLPEDVYPNTYDYQLYIVDVATKEVTPVTKDFNPSIEDFQWSEYDNKIYVTALDKECSRLYQIDPKTLKAQQVMIPQCYVGHFYLSAKSPLIGTAGQSAADLGKSYLINAKTLKFTQIEDMHQRELSEYLMPEAHEFTFTSSHGDEITGWYLMPPAEVIKGKDKLPLIVYYYGGCSPITRYFSRSYGFEAMASQGYVMYFVEPRGAAGFGQEFAAWHGNTAGDPQVEDIIEGTNKICEALPIIDRTKIGCLGASYGGFMTQYLQTKTDMFACAISHAGISNHSSYWGFGYWGYSYSQVSMPGKYPWSDRKLYTDNSPLFNADKVKTPLLFLHGTDDRNVPPIESSQMFTALRLLGKDAAYVTFQGEGHHIQQYDRLLNWQQTMQAWFAKYLKGDDTWWNALYKEQSLY